MLKNTFLVTVFLIISAILGFLAQIVFVSTFGASVEMDMYFKILSVPAIITGISPIIFSSVFIPYFAKFKSNQEELKKFNESIWIFIVGFGLLFILIGIIITTLNIDFFVPENSVYLRQTGIQISFMIWIGSGFMILSSFLSAILNYEKQFFKVAWTSILPSFSMIVCVLLFHEFIGVRSISLGFCIALVLQFFIFIYASKISINFSNFSIKNLRNERQLLKQSYLVTLSLLPFTILAPIAYFWASKLEIGSIAYLGYSQNFAGFLSVVISMGISIVSFPELADRFANEEGEYILNKFEKSLKFVLLMGMFAAGLLIVLRLPILSLFYQRGSFDSLAVNNLSSILLWYLLAAVFTGGLNFLRTLFYSKGEFEKIAFLGLLIPIIFFILAGILKEQFSLIGIGIANVIAFLLLFFISTFLAKNKEFKFLTNDFYFFITKNAIAIIFSCTFVNLSLPFMENVVSEFFIILLCSLLFTFLYMLSSKFLLKIKEVDEITLILMNKLKSF